MAIYSGDCSRFCLRKENINLHIRLAAFERFLFSHYLKNSLERTAKHARLSILQNASVKKELPIA